MSSGVASNWADSTPLATFEGVTVLMYQQSARYIFKQLKQLDKEKQLRGFFQYMNYMDRLINSKCAAKDVKEFVNLENLTQTMATRASFYILECKELMRDPEFTEKKKNNERYAI